MRDGWDKKSIGEIAAVEYGFTGKAVVEGFYRYVRITDIDNNGELSNENKRYLEYTQEAKKFILNDNDLLMARTGATFAKVLLYKDYEPSLFASYLIRINFRDKVLNKLYWYFSKSESYWEQANSLSSGSAQPHFNGAALKKMAFTYPTCFTEQKQIVAILDKAFEAIAKAKANIERNIENAKELFQSKLNEIFSQKGEGWEEKSLGELGKVSMCKRILKKQTTTSGDIPFYKIGTFGKSPNAFIDINIFQEFKEKYSFPKKGDILISASGTIGRRVVYDGKPAYFQDSNIVWIDNNEDLVLNEYLYQFYGVCIWNPSKGATISRLYNDDLRRIKITFPDIVEQKKLIEKMVKLNFQTQAVYLHYQQKFDKLTELKKSILQKAFAGELTKNETAI